MKEDVMRETEKTTSMLRDAMESAPRYSRSHEIAWADLLDRYLGHELEPGEDMDRVECTADSVLADGRMVIVELLRDQAELKFIKENFGAFKIKSEDSPNTNTNTNTNHGALDGKE